MLTLNQRPRPSGVRNRNGLSRPYKMGNLSSSLAWPGPEKPSCSSTSSSCCRRSKSLPGSTPPRRPGSTGHCSNRGIVPGETRILRWLRGECDVDGLRMIEQRNCSRSVPDSPVVELYPTNRDVMRVNEERFRRLNKEIFVFRAVDTGKEIAPDEISLCEGARVMLIKNLNARKKLVNSATGTVVGFRKVDTSVNEDFGEVCWDGLMPEVEFNHGATLVVEPETWAVEEGDKVVAKRKQIPLIFAWSVSTHKCQGMSLDRLSTNLYVALFRVRSLEGLFVSGFKPSKVKAHPKVVQFYKKLVRERDQVGKDGVSEQKEDIGADKPLAELGRSSNGELKFHFSLSEYLLSSHIK